MSQINAYEKPHTHKDQEKDDVIQCSKGANIQAPLDIDPTIIDRVSLFDSKQEL